MHDAGSSMHWLYVLDVVFAPPPVPDVPEPQPARPTMRKNEVTRRRFMSIEAAEGNGSDPMDVARGFAAAGLASPGRVRGGRRALAPERRATGKIEAHRSCGGCRDGSQFLDARAIGVRRDQRRARATFRWIARASRARAHVF